jgi:adenosylcobinamide-phosphate synthase
MSRRSGLASGLLLGSALDALLADPGRGHPVAAFGTAAAGAERRFWRASRARGALFTVACAGPVAAAGWAGQQRAGRRPLPGAALAAAATWAVLGGASLAAEAAGVSRALAAGDLEDARRRLPALCGRDPAGLPAAELARAAVESVAENTCDAVVAPLLWGAVAGVGGLLGYRAVNTLDAMVGHHNMRYERFGWAAARLDDVANLVPARLTAVLAATLAPAVGGSGRAALRTVRRDGAAHPSPNAGRCEAAFAGALGVSLGGTNVYQGRAERRGTLGDGPPPRPADLDRAIRLSRLITAAAAALCAALAYLLSGRGTERGTHLPGRTRRPALARVCHGWRNHHILWSRLGANRRFWRQASAMACAIEGSRRRFVRLRALLSWLAQSSQTTAPTGAAR